MNRVRRSEYDDHSLEVNASDNPLVKCDVFMLLEFPLRVKNNLVQLSGHL